MVNFLITIDSFGSTPYLVGDKSRISPIKSLWTLIRYSHPLPLFSGQIAMFHPFSPLFARLNSRYLVQMSDFLPRVILRRFPPSNFVLRLRQELARRKRQALRFGLGAKKKEKHPPNMSKNGNMVDGCIKVSLFSNFLSPEMERWYDDPIWRQIGSGLTLFFSFATNFSEQTNNQRGM